jgi:CheY-like chemotaxis protein
MIDPALIIDDNDGYADMLVDHLAPRGYQFDRARSAKEGLEMLIKAGPEGYALIVTDITMEGQTAGLKLIRQVRRHGYRNVMIVASTGFNWPIVLHLLRPFLTIWGVDVLIPKEPLKRGMLKCQAVSSVGRAFLEET